MCNLTYFGETKKKISTRIIEDSFNEKWNKSGATEHITCHAQLNWIHPKTIVRKSDYRKRKTRELLDIKKVKYSQKLKVF